MSFASVTLEKPQEMSSEGGNTSCIPKPFPGERPGTNMLGATSGLKGGGNGSLAFHAFDRHGHKSRRTPEKLRG